MEMIFLTIFNMTYTASFVIAAIIIARLFLNKTPKVISYILWIAAGFRLVFPFSFESVVSLIPVNTQPIPQDIVEHAVPSIDTGIPAIDDYVSSILPVATQTGINYLQILITAGSIIWFIGIIAMLVYSNMSMFKLKRILKDAILLEDNIYEAKIKTPFVMGFFKPKIYLPLNLTGEEREHVILHERTHIRRHDNIIKGFAYCILSVHWFNPLVWAAFILMSMDMEMSCDESVLSKTGKKTKKAYSRSILALATEQRHTINIYPLAFGEGDTIRRIKNVLNYKKHSKIKIVVSFILVTVLTIGFMFNSQISANNSQQNDDFDQAIVILRRIFTINIHTKDDVISDENLTRADMAFYAATLYGDEINFYITKSGVIPIAFPDGSVSQIESTISTTERDYEKAIQKCISNNIMAAEWFAEPDSTVTLEDAIQMLVKALRYQEVNDYLKFASTQKVRLLGKYAVFPFAGVSKDKILSKNDVLMLSYNFLLSEYAVEVVSKYAPVYTPNPNWNPDDPESSSSLVEHPYSFKSVIRVFGMYVATPISSKVTVDGKETAFDAYNIDSKNYFKIRDLAYALNGTSKQFEVSHKPVPQELIELHGDIIGRMIITTGKPYTIVGGEMAQKGKNSMTTFEVPSSSITIDDDEENIKAVLKALYDVFRINEDEYFSLREVAQKLDFSVTWDEAKNLIAIDTSKPYTP